MDEIEKSLVKRLLIALAKKRFPNEEIKPSGSCETLEKSITIDNLGDITIAMLWFNVGKDTRGERIKLIPKNEGDEANAI